LGTFAFTLPISPWLEDGNGIIWGGVYALLADAPISLSLYTGLPPGKSLTTSELSINYLRVAARASDRLVGRGRSVYLGRDVGVAEATIEDANGRTMAHATTRCVVVDVPIMPDAVTPPIPEPITDPPDPYLRPVPDGLRFDPAEWSGTPLDTQRRFIAGELPRSPLETLMGLTMHEIDDGRGAGTLPASPWLSLGAPTMYGGALAMACDWGLTGATWASLDAGELGVSLDLQVRFVRPVPLDGRPVTIEASVRHKGRRIRIAEADAFDADGRRVAFAVGSSMVIHGDMQMLKRGRS
ncbi:MAG: hotdog fold thioesterase, partial [Actinobacteria bacterium]|nr:hotdog fold thioesterase [Actinomycetota bacterium]NIS35953.1 hotdog fold thioesterase [Actinomycetota bacterium]NIU70550.1 hotdog fold thioesterase [Actinomycetota bacterium]NIW32453.1 hotdog fold thioesterase [Actinomycetota bacterium]NIX25819.1 hotdog fold thioesterase [Actinomycetota bacterium]